MDTPFPLDNNCQTAQPANYHHIEHENFDSDIQSNEDLNPSPKVTCSFSQSQVSITNSFQKSDHIENDNGNYDKILLKKSKISNFADSNNDIDELQKHSEYNLSNIENINIFDFKLSNEMNQIIEQIHLYKEDGLLKQNNYNNSQSQQKKDHAYKRLIPRDYQMKIFEEAKDKNSIAFLETGKGKTIIAILLMQYILGLDSKSDKSPNNKKIIFFVCDSALIKQQVLAIQNQLNIEVGTLQGKKSKKSKSDYDEFRATFNSKNVFVAIPDVVYKLLSIGFLKMSEVDLLVFDECHHTDSNHTYNSIMNEFYFFYKKKKGKQYKFPLILGLTASPLKSKIGPSVQLTALKSITLLCENLDSQMIIDPELCKNENKIDDMFIKDELQNKEFVKVDFHIEHHNYKPLIQFIYQHFLTKFSLLALNSLIIKKSDDKNILDTFNEQYVLRLQNRFQSKTIVEYNNSFQNFPGLAQLAENNIILFIFEKIQRNLFMLLENLNLDAIISFFALYSRKFNEMKDREFSNDGFFFEEIINLNHKQIQEISTIFEGFVEKLNAFAKTTTYESDRVIKLYSKINAIFNHNPHSKCIIFVPNRIVSFFLEHVLSKYLTTLKYNFKEYKCISIIGVNKKKTGLTISPTNSLNILNEKIQKFNRGDVQILIGTSAVEEGLDIQTCNVVMVFTELNTAKSYIQMNGRARQKNSKFLAFASSPSTTQDNIERFIILSQCMRELFQGKISKEFKKHGYMDDRGELNIYYEIPSTEAKITIKNSTQLFHEISHNFSQNQLLLKISKQWEKQKNPKENPEFLYQCRMKFEGAFGLNEIKSKYHIDKSSGESECYVHIITLFHKIGLVDNHFKFIKKNEVNFTYYFSVV